MNSKVKIAIAVILAIGLQINSNGQTITFNNLKRIIASRDYKDSIINALKFKKISHIPQTAFTPESELYRSTDSSKTIELVYKDSAIGCVLYTNDLNLLQKIISDGQKDGFDRLSRFVPNPRATAYIKGEILLLFDKNDQDMRKSNVSLTRNYKVLLKSK